IDEVVWDYQVVADDGVETEIFLASMRSSEADDLCATLASVGIVVDAIDASSVLDYNAWKYCGLDADSVVLNVGAKFSNMIIVRDDGMFVRSISAGGNVVTQSIADSLGQSFVGAEELKRRYMANETAGVAGAEHFVSGSDTLKKRICDELRRSIVNYRRQGRVNPPSKIYLTGAASALNGLAEYLMENLKMNVEFIDALSNISVSPKVNQAMLSDSTLRMSEVVGEAARMVYSDAMGVNLLPHHITDERAFAKKRPVFVLAAAILAASVVPPFMYLSESLKLDKKYAKAYEQKAPEFVERASEFEQEKKLAEKLVAKIDGLDGLARSKSNWIELFIDLEQRLMEQKDVWLEKLRVVRVNDGKVQKYNLELTGRLLIRDYNKDDPDAYDHKKASQRITDLLKSFENSTFIQKYENVRTDPTNKRILKFDFTLVVDPKKPI
ncbi:MAG: pilus assembly protein PilM, partial [Opitutales bacterium]|nr:pilus assembly protein PilM [Opitutales bacterium]